jgi:hypothetical protein
MSTEDHVPIPLKPRIDINKAPMPTFSLKHNTLDVTTDILGLTKCTTTNLETVLYTVNKIKDLFRAHRLNVTNGPHCFQYAREFFVGTVHKTWDLATAGLTRTVANFEVALQIFFKQLSSEEAYSDQHHYLMQLKKPTEMPVPTLVARIRQIQELMQHLPCREQEPAMTDHDFKYIVFNTHPQLFCNQYTLKYEDSIHAITIQQLSDRLGRIQHVLDYKPNHTGPPNKKQKTGGTNNTSSNNNNNTNNGSNRGGGNKGQSRDPSQNWCCIPGHSGHLRKDC